MLVIRVQK